MAEKEYIERGAIQKIVYERLEDLEDLYGVYDAYGQGYEECADRISEAPAADVVEVVRCKDCKHKVVIFGRPPFAVYVCTHNKGLGDNVKEDDFCSHGERKTE